MVGSILNYDCLRIHSLSELSIRNKRKRPNNSAHLDGVVAGDEVGERERGAALVKLPGMHVAHLARNSNFVSILLNAI